MATIRELFHDLSNKLNLMTVGCGATADTVKDLTEEPGIPQARKDQFLEIYNNLKKIEEGAMQADGLISELHKLVYEVINPDTGQPKPPKVQNA